MTGLLACLAFVVMSAVGAIVSCAYHRAMREERALSAANWGLLVDALQMAPILFLWFADSPTAVIGDFVGGWFGVFFGVRYINRKNAAKGSA